MPRTAEPATPGTDPAATTDAAPKPDAFQATGSVSGKAPDPDEAVVQEGLKAELATKENADLKAQLNAQAEAHAKDMAEMRAMLLQINRNQTAQAVPDRVDLPELHDVIAQAPKVSVLTKGGWYVPPVHPTDRLGKA